MAERVINISPAEREALIRTVLAEAGGENPIGQIAVANVILNRVKSDRYPDTIQGVVSQDKQFSSYGNKLYNSDLNTADAQKVVQNVDMLLSGNWKGGDPTQGGTHFYSTKMMKDAPYWWGSESKKGSVQIGGHKFAKGGLKNSQEDDGWKFDISKLFGSPAEASTIQNALNADPQNKAFPTTFVNPNKSISASIMDIPQWLIDTGVLPPNANDNYANFRNTANMLMEDGNMIPVDADYEMDTITVTPDKDNNMVKTNIDGGSDTESDKPFRFTASQSNLLANLSRGLLTQPDISSALAKAQELTQDQIFGNTQFAQKGYQMGQVYMSPMDGKIYEAIFDRATGKMMYRSEGKMYDALPAGSVPYSQSGEGSFAIASGKSLASFNDSIGRIPQSMRNIKSLRNLLASSGEQFVGPTVMNSFMRSMATSFGLDFGGDLDDLTEAKRALKDMMVESAQRLKGQGQITENERKMLADSLANIETLTPKALIKALDILEKGMKNTMAKADAWANSGLRPNQWYEWSTNWDLKRAQREFKNASDILDEI
tara:strand:- start:2408 stop:4039 length:1632 start_codon:yes stop_codon:yes gene_type:complete